VSHPLLPFLQIIKVVSPTPWMGVYDSSKAAVRLLTEVLSMECKPFDIRVMLVAPGSIQSRIIDKHDGFQLTANSIYGAFLHNIRQRLDAARNRLAMPADKFAEEIVSKALRSNPPSYILTGGNSTLFRFLGYLPRWLYLSIMWRMFSRPSQSQNGISFGLVHAVWVPLIHGTYPVQVVIVFCLRNDN
jgi:short-subunit dehydrogenase